jgi:membrane protein
MPAWSDRLTRLRERHPPVDHAVRAGAHYAERNGSGQAGAVTFFGFLSFFPVLALAFWAVGHVTEVYPDLRAEVVGVVEEALPGLVGDQQGQIQLWEIEQYAATVGWIGLLSLAYTGLAWLSGMRNALSVMFCRPRGEQPGFVLGKVRDLATLLLLGAVLLVSVGLTGLVSWFSAGALELVGLQESVVAAVLLGVLGLALATGATTVLFLAIFRFLARPQVARRALWQGALAGAVGFEVLKAVAGLLIGLTRSSPAFVAFGVSLILLVWINYTSRLVMLSAAWAYTAPVAEELRSLDSTPLMDPEEAEELVPAPATVVAEAEPGSPPPAVLRRRRRERLGGAGAALLAAVATLTWLGRRRHEERRAG